MPDLLLVEFCFLPGVTKDLFDQSAISVLGACFLLYELLIEAVYRLRNVHQQYISVVELPGLFLMEFCYEVYCDKGIVRTRAARMDLEHVFFRW